MKSSQGFRLLCLSPKVLVSDFITIIIIINLEGVARLTLDSIFDVTDPFSKTIDLHCSLGVAFALTRMQVVKSPRSKHVRWLY